MIDPEATEAAADPVAAVDAARARGAAKADPARFRVIEALARRAAAQRGEARQLLMRRVEALLAEHATARPDAAAADSIVHAGALSGLRELVDQLGRSHGSQRSQSHAAAPSAAEPPAPLKAVTAFRRTWARLRAEQRVRHAAEHVPVNAGPLNSSHVVHRALQAMREIAPEYLDAFLSHADTLLWLEEAGGAAELARHRAARPQRPQRPADRRKARTPARRGPAA